MLASRVVVFVITPLCLGELCISRAQRNLLSDVIDLIYSLKLLLVRMYSMGFAQLLSHIMLCIILTIHGQIVLELYCMTMYTTIHTQESQNTTDTVRTMTMVDLCSKCFLNTMKSSQMFDIVSVIIGTAMNRKALSKSMFLQ